MGEGRGKGPQIQDSVYVSGAVINIFVYNRLLVTRSVRGNTKLFEFYRIWSELARFYCESQLYSA